MRTYFSITPSDAAASGLPVYNAHSGFKDWGVNVLGHYTPGKHWGFAGFVKYNKLLGHAEDSPIVQDEGDENQFAAGLALTYKF